MPSYQKSCSKCEKNYELFCSFAEAKKHKCSDCKVLTEMLISSFGITFDNPKESSKWDNFGYRAGHLATQAKKEREAAEKREGNPNPYGD